MKAFLMKTNSWHWLCAALIVSLGLMGWLWCTVVTPVREKTQREIGEIESRLQELRQLTPDRVQTANAKEKRWKTIAEREAEAYAALRVDPLPKGSDAIFKVKNRLDAALSAHGLRVASSEVQVAMPKTDLESKVAVEKREMKSSLPRDANDYLRRAEAMASRLPPQERARVLAELRKQSSQMEQVRRQQQKEESAKASAAQIAAKRRISPQKLPFKSTEISYEAEGDFRNMFMFLVEESMRRSAYHLKDLAVVRTPEGFSRMTFILQVDYR